MIDLDYTILIQLGIFLVLYVALNSLLFKPILQLFEERERLVAGMKAEAAALEKEFHEKSAAFDEAVREATAKAAAAMEKIKGEGQAAQRDILGRARTEAARRVEDAVKDLRAEAEAIRGAMEKDVGSIAVQIAEKVLGRKIA